MAGQSVYATERTQDSAGFLYASGQGFFTLLI